MKKYFLFFAKTFVSAAILYYFFSKIEFSTYYTQLREVDPFIFGIGLLFFVLHFFIYTYKWHILVDMFGIKVRYTTLANVTLIGLFYGLFLPGGFLAGEAVKCYKITRGQNNKLKLIYSVLLDRIVGFIAFIIIGIIALLVSQYTDKQIITFFIVSGIIAAVTYTLLIMKQSNQLIARLLPNKKMKQIVQNLQSNPEHIHKSVLTGIVVQIVLTASVYFFLESLGQHIAFVHLIWIYAITSTITMIPLSFLGLGFREFSFIFLLGKFGFPDAVSLNLATLVVVAMVIRGLVGGALEFIAFLKNNALKYSRTSSH